MHNTKEKIKVDVEIDTKYDKEFELLIHQRNLLIDALAKTNSTFQKTLIALFTGLISMIATESIKEIKNSIVILSLLQIVILLFIFIIMLLITGNEQRNYISAIDDFILERYDTNVLVYQGKIARDHIIGKKSFYTYIFSALYFTMFLFMFWLVYELDIVLYFAEDVLYIVLLVMELLLIILLLVHDFVDKFREPKAYKMCLDYLRKAQLKVVKSKEQKEMVKVEKQNKNNKTKKAKKR